MLNSEFPATKQRLLFDVHNFVREFGIAPTTFGMEAVRDPSFIKRLEAGHDVRTDKLDRAYAYMAAARAKRGAAA